MIFFPDVGDAHDEHTHLPLGCVYHTGWDMDERALLDLVFDSIQNHDTLAVEHVV